MKKVILVLMLGMIVGCGIFGSDDNNAGACSGSVLLGDWTSGNHRVEFRPNCTGYASFCQSEFNYEHTIAKSGTVVFNSITNHRDRYCARDMGNACRYDISGQGLYLNCGFAVEYFTRRR